MVSTNALMAELRALRSDLAVRTPTATLRAIAREWWPRKAAAIPGSEPQARSRLFKHILPRFGGLSSGRISRMDVQAWMLELTVTGSPQSANHCRKLALQLIDYALEVGTWAGRNPFADAKPLPVDLVERPILDRKEARRLLRVAEHPWRCAIALALYLGLRVGEIWGIKKEDVDLAAGWLHVRRSHAKEKTKNGKRRKLPITRSLRKYLREALGLSTCAWLVTDTGRQLNRHRKAARLLRRRLLLAEIERVVDFHSLRHASASWLLEDGCHPWVVGRVLGHSGIAVPDITWRYTHFSDEWIRAEVEKLNL